MSDQIDRNLVIENTAFDENMQVYDVTKAPFLLYGNSKAAKNIFSRMDEESAAKVSPAVENRGARSAGVRLKFQTDSKRLGIRASFFVSFHAPALNTISALGFDIYAGHRFLQPVFPQSPEVKLNNSYEQVVELPGTLQEITVYFPYNAVVTDFCIALDKGAAVLPSGGYLDIAPLVFYGSSITHGYCVSRPGNTFTAKISRNLNVDYINLGFSGAARGEPAMAEYLASLKKSAVICEYDHNEPSVQSLGQRHLPFYQTFRETDKETPILFLSKPDRHDTPDDTERRTIIENTYRYALAAGDTHVYYVNGLTLFPDSQRYDCTIDTIHPNDLGAFWMAEKLTEKLREILAL